MKEHQNWCVIDANHSKWKVWNTILQEVQAVVKKVQIYLERRKEGKRKANFPRIFLSKAAMYYVHDNFTFLWMTLILGHIHILKFFNLICRDL